MEDDMTLLCTCSCGDLLARGFDRRRFLQMAGGAAAAAAFPFTAAAAYGNYEAMLLSCIDPRTQEPVRAYMEKQGLIGKYSQFTFAGAAIGVVAPKFNAWHKTYWDNLGATVQLHSIKKVVAIDHRDCGACRIAYGDKSTSTPEIETEQHRKVFAQFRREMAKRQPKLAVETGLMALDGKLEMLTA
jgi:carbonic anhydrase